MKQILHVFIIMHKYIHTDGHTFSLFLSLYIDRNVQRLSIRFNTYTCKSDCLTAVKSNAEIPCTGISLGYFNQRNTFWKSLDRISSALYSYIFVLFLLHTFIRYSFSFGHKFIVQDNYQSISNSLSIWLLADLSSTINKHSLTRM